MFSFHVTYVLHIIKNVSFRLIEILLVVYRVSRVSSYKTSRLVITYFGVTPKPVVVPKPNIHKTKRKI